MFTRNSFLTELRGIVANNSSPGTRNGVGILVTKDLNLDNGLRTTAGLTLTASTTPAVVALETNALGIQWVAGNASKAAFQFAVPEDYDIGSDTMVLSMVINSGGNTDAPNMVANVYQKRGGAALSADLAPAMSAAIAKGSTEATSAAETTITLSGAGLLPNDVLTFQLAPTGGTQSVASATVTVAGSGYTSVPTIAFSGGGGSSAAATAVMGVGAIASTAGSGYTSAPTVGFTGGSGSGATATVVLSGGGLGAFTVTAPGTGYTSAPTVTLTGGGGSSGAGTATLKLTSVTIGTAGTGYTSAPTMAYSGGGGTLAASTAVLGGSHSVDAVDLYALSIRYYSCIVNFKSHLR